MLMAYWKSVTEETMSKLPSGYLSRSSSMTLHFIYIPHRQLAMPKKLGNIVVVWLCSLNLKILYVTIFLSFFSILTAPPPHPSRLEVTRMAVNPPPSPGLGTIQTVNGPLSHYRLQDSLHYHVLAFSLQPALSFVSHILASSSVAAVKGTQEWQFFWLRFWILYYFVKYA